MTEEKHEAELVEFPLEEFLYGKALWAANYYVLWPLGLALTVTSEEVSVEGPDGEPITYKEFTRLAVREWTYPEGEKIETINQDTNENQADFQAFATWAHKRLMGMKPDERMAALASLAMHRVVTAEQLVAGSD